MFALDDDRILDPLQYNDDARPQSGSAFDLPLSMPLAVDLDRTLITGDMLHESIRSALRHNPFDALLYATRLWGGRAGLKRAFARHCHIDWDRITLHQDVLELVLREKAAGRSVALATASDALLAEQIAAHLSVFDRVLASDGRINLKGAAKAQALEQMFPGGFIYAGDSRADLPIWQRAQAIVLVGADRSVVQAARALGKPTLELSGRTSR
jgi:phosphoserine phosphatase